jgi:hypothetical protein
MPRLGFDPTTPVFERANIVHALDRTANMIGNYIPIYPIFLYCILCL